MQTAKGEPERNKKKGKGDLVSYPTAIKVHCQHELFERVLVHLDLQALEDILQLLRVDRTRRIGVIHDEDSPHLVQLGLGEVGDGVGLPVHRVAKEALDFDIRRLRPQHISGAEACEELPATLAGAEARGDVQLKPDLIANEL